MRFADKVAVVTGGASGIGEATVALLAKEGAHVFIVDRDVAMGEALATKLGPTVRFLPCEVTQAVAVESAVAAVLKHAAQIDVLVTSAGISRGQRLIETQEDVWNEVFDVNVKGTFLWMKAVLAHMVERQAGTVVTVASQLAFAGGTHNAAYIASKGAIVSLTKTAALEHAEDGVRINSVAPGATETPLLARSMARGGDPDAARQRSSHRHGMKRLGRPAEIAGAIAYLASAEASFTTGVVLPVDGGWLVA